MPIHNINKTYDVKKITQWRWYEIWIKAIFHPTLHTFELIGYQARRRKSYDWFFIGAFIFSWGMTGTNRPLEEVPAICARSLLTSLSLTFLFIILATLLNSTARVLGGHGNYEQHVFATSSFIAPLAIIGGFLAISDQTYFLIIPSLYVYYLIAVSTKAIHSLNWVRAFIVGTLIYTFLLILAFAFVQAYNTIISFGLEL